MEETQQNETVDLQTGEILPAVRDSREVEQVITLEHLAQITDETNFIESYSATLNMARRASIAMTEPEDWVLFRRPAQDGEEGRVTAYLQDSGCQRIEDLWKIDVIPPTGKEDFIKERIAAPGSEEFAWTFTGNGHCHRTGKKVVNVEGVRRSDEDFVRYKSGIQKEIEVRKAAFANLHGGIVRRLTGLGSVSVRLLEEVWTAQNLGKKVDHCARGKGFGTQSERLGEARNVEYGDPPQCPKCQRKMVLRQGKRGPFWGCPGYPKCDQKPIDAKPVAKKAEPAAAPEQPPQGEDPGPAPPRDEPPAENAEVSLSETKNKLLERIKGKPWDKADLKGMILKAKGLDDIMTVETLISDRERVGK